MAIRIISTCAFDRSVVYILVFWPPLWII